ncbi:caspase family protein [Roseicyclus sp. F158]|uniref:Caspase family protein n=1 Tax=Tropicimonas omnivorans TaxID=3075590 RepID=A0ABU3DE24_9RHOB|nr:caspase family protein [Roseicyclus sp. F158]MDT0681961.1 caspase family protein [Roseicyclus sp. F158]
MPIALTHFGRRFGTRALRAAPLVFLAAGAATTADAKRMALIVGNSEYEHVYSLNNATNDAADMADALRQLDFEVTLLTDTGAADFMDKLDAFAAEAETAESTLFFFSGHAFQMEGVNYLVPSDAALTSADAIKTETWRLDTIIEKLESRNRQTLVFLDACRNNPLPEGQRAASGDGLAKLTTGSGTFVAFATQPNNVTSDGTGENSPFTDSLLKHVSTPGISISDMMIQVRNDVEEATFGRQTPWDQSSLRAQFYFQPVQETVPELTDADIEMIALLDPDTARRLLAALGATGVNVGIEIVDVEEVEEPQIQFASAEPGFFIDDPDAPAPEPGFAILDVTDAPATATESASASTDFASLAPGGGMTVLGGKAERARMAAAASASQAESDQVASAGASAAARAGTDEIASAGADGAAGTAGSANSLAASGDALASVLPEDPTARGTASGILDNNALVLAALGPSRSLDPIFAPNASIRGEEVDPETAGIDLPAQELGGRELAAAVQTELARLGCYRAAVDGAFGRLSALALTRYYIARKTAVDELKPTNALLHILRSESEVLCTGVVAPKTTQVASAAPKRSTVVRKAAPEPVVRTSAPARSNTGAKKVIKRTTTTTNSQGQTQRKVIKRMNTGVFR